MIISSVDEISAGFVPFFSVLYGGKEMSTVVEREVTSQEVDAFVIGLWAQRPKGGNVLRKCPKCLERWKKFGRAKGEEKPRGFPPDYEGNCLCGSPLTAPQAPL
jgi:hypothetical protein